MGTPFDEDTTVERIGDGRYLADLSDRWNLRPLPQGGVLSALAVRAMEVELGHDEQRLRTSHTTFVRQVTHGALEIDVEVLRRGRSMSQLRAEVRNVGASHGHVTTAVFGARRDGWEFTELEAPTAIAPEDSLPFRDFPRDTPNWSPMPFWDEQIEARVAVGHRPWEVYEPRDAERLMWLRFDDPPVNGGGTLDPLALLVMADLMPGAAAERIGGSPRPWFGPSVDLTFHLLDDCSPGWVLAHNTARHAGEGYASVDATLWDGDRPVAYATQLFFFTFLD